MFGYFRPNLVDERGAFFAWSWYVKSRVEIIM